jgi:hypothetical protein
MKLIFVDLDNTLISASYLYVPSDEDVNVLKLGVARDEEEFYTAKLRGGALNMLSELRKIGSVFMLTAATKDYAIGWNKMFNLGFGEKEIYSREDTSFGSLHLPKGDVHLIDDLPATMPNTRTKINFLKPSSTSEVNLIVIRGYDGIPTQDLTPEYIKDIIDQIND